MQGDAPYHVVLSKIGSLVATVPNPAILFQKACEYLVNQTESSGAYFAMIGKSSSETSVLASAGIPTDFLQRLKLSVDPDEPGGNGLVGRVYRESKPVGADDSQNDSRFEEMHELLRISNIRSGIGIPLFVDSKCCGVLVLVSEKVGHYSAVVLKLLEQMAEILAIGIDRAEQCERRARYQTLYTIQSEVNKLVARTPEPRELYQETCRIVAKTSGVLWADIHVPDTTGECLWLVASSGPELDTKLLEARKSNPLSTHADALSGQGIAGTTFRAGKTTLWADVPAEQEFELREILRRQTATRSLLGVPVLVDGNCRALLVLASTEPDFFDDELIAVSEQVAQSLSVALNAHEQRFLLEQIALTDALTGLSNRSQFSHRLTTAMSRVDQEGGKLIVALVNLDGFHEINARFGRQVGDTLLRTVTTRLAFVRNHTDTIARLDGDEFAVLLLEKQDGVSPEAVLSTLLRAFDDAFQLGVDALNVHASVGTSTYPDDGPTAEDLMRRADLALLRAKSAGGGITERFTPSLEEEFSKRSLLKTQLLEAIQQGEIIFHYQPVVELPWGRVVGAEALARWAHPQDGLLSPEEWISIVEENPQLIVALGRHALATAVNQLSDWHTADNCIWLAVNVGVHHLLSGSFFEDLRGVLVQAPHLATYLVIEITETALIEDFKKVASVLARCRTLGVHIALDDFGTGQASLLYLQELPADHLKIDRVFVSQMLSNLRAFGIVRATAQVTRMLDMDVIAEGVETETQGLRLMGLGYRYAQGFAIAPPLPIPTFKEWQQQWVAPTAWKMEEMPLFDTGQAEILACLVRHRERFQQLLDAEKNDDNTAPDAILSWSRICPLQEHSSGCDVDTGYNSLLEIDREIHELEIQCAGQWRDGSAPKRDLIEQFAKHMDVFERSVVEVLDAPTRAAP